ncbi:MAG: hypothetical protein LBS51_08665 [Oscillospiraceae bacterium]|jgi:hypothetical protein|nr:hypothetical protein [Oscillospiraceae bacterium]
MTFSYCSILKSSLSMEIIKWTYQKHYSRVTVVESSSLNLYRKTVEENTFAI